MDEINEMKMRLFYEIIIIYVISTKTPESGKKQNYFGAFR